MLSVMVIAFIVNCMTKIIRDHKIIRVSIFLELGGKGGMGLYLEVVSDLLQVVSNVPFHLKFKI